MFLAVVAEVIRQLGNADGGLLAAFFLAVEDAQGILFQAGLAVVAELILFVGEEIEKLLPVNRTAFRAADGIEMKD